MVKREHEEEDKAEGSAQKRARTREDASQDGGTEAAGRDDLGAVDPASGNQAAAAKAEPASDAGEDDDDQIMLPKSSSRAAIKRGNECPYIDTITRQVCSWHGRSR